MESHRKDDSLFERVILRDVEEGIQRQPNVTFLFEGEEIVNAHWKADIDVYLDSKARVTSVAPRRYGWKVSAYNLSEEDGGFLTIDGTFPVGKDVVRKETSSSLSSSSVPLPSPRAEAPQKHATVPESIAVAGEIEQSVPPSLSYLFADFAKRSFAVEEFLTNEKNANLFPDSKGRIDDVRKMRGSSVKRKKIPAFSTSSSPPLSPLLSPLKGDAAHLFDGDHARRIPHPRAQRKLETGLM
eukprot:TRINITY_DN2272_c0_g1_i1.p1 TRINITY_DN2272_c0_g1~~TRINITY_DN2272_c0_g1_i1.p1  ORF type:complete len:270 (+),score=88.07 TRINITY_DN2272_c0_g1_i1:89-811(+)